MMKQTITFAVKTDKNGIVQEIGKSYIYQPKIIQKDNKKGDKHGVQES